MNWGMTDPLFWTRRDGWATECPRCGHTAAMDNCNCTRDDCGCTDG